MLDRKVRWLLGLGRMARQACAEGGDLITRMIHRIAARKIHADFRTELDELARLQVVLGALDYGDAEIAGGVWAKGSAAKHLEHLQADLPEANINAMFFQGGNLGVFDIPHRTVMRELRSGGVSPEQADDVMQILMSGVGYGGRSRKLAFAEIGRKYKNRILNNKFKPGHAAAIASRFAQRSVATYLKTYFKKLGIPPAQDGPANLFRDEKAQYYIPKGQEKQFSPELFEEKWREREIPADAVMPHRDRLDTLVDLFKDAFEDPIGKILAAYARKVFFSYSEDERSRRKKRRKNRGEGAEDRATAGEMAAYYLLQLADKGSAPSWVEMAKRYDYTSMGVLKKVTDAIQHLGKKLRTDPQAKVPQTGQNLLDAMEWAAIQEKMTGRRRASGNSAIR